ncbi:MAG: glycosyltransferase [Cyclobacteriaceae bacterium]
MRIVLASILKPVDDTRMYEKLAQSIAETNKYEINIIGFRSKVPLNHSSIRSFPLFDLQRSGLKRIFAPFHFLKKVIKLKPALLIIGTYELLPAACFYKTFFRAKIIYDVREDYKQNILTQNSLPQWSRHLAATLVRLVEHCAQPWIDHHLLAEKVYLHLPFVKQNHTILENKFGLDLDKLPVRQNKDRLRFIYSGTIARSFGIFEALELFEKLHAIHPSVELEIVGYAADKKVLDDLKGRIFDKPHIRLVGGPHLVPHQTIIHHLAQADFGLVAYRKEPNIINRFPTKIFEYLALGLPMILQNHEAWVDFCQESEAAIAIDYQDYDVATIWEQINQKKYYPQGPPAKAYWSQEGILLRDLVGKLLLKSR